MTLSEIRARFVTESGRDDLVLGDGSDNGADLYINTGIRMLDLFQENPKTRGTHRVDIVAGTSFVDIQYARVIEEVYLSRTSSETDEDSGRIHLEEKDLSWLKEEYVTIPLTNIEQGTPLYWAIVSNAGLGPEFFSAADSGDLSATYDLENILFGDHHHKTRIIILPPPDQTFTLEVEAKFFSKELLVDTDYNYWTKRYPLLVIMTASLIAEGMLRNSEGVRDWLNLVQLQTNQIEYDLVEQESKNNNVMRG